MAGEVCSLRVKYETRERLRTAIKAMADWCHLHPACDIRDNLDNHNIACEEISFDRFLNHLLDQREAKHERSRKHKRARARRRKPSRASVERIGGER